MHFEETMEALLNIVNWYASLYDTFIWMYSVEKSPHALQNFSFDKLVMQEVSYHITTKLFARLHCKKKEPWPTLLLWIGLYEIRNFKNVDVKAEEIKKYTFDI